MPLSKLIITLAASIIACADAFSLDIVLSEIMFNPSGDENANEFIELYNADQFPQDMTGWKISDGGGTDSLVETEQGMMLLPYHYAVILDPDYFADSSTTYDGMIPTGALLLTINNSNLGSGGLHNTNPEMITLIDNHGVSVSIYTYSVGNADGHSDEKVIVTGGNEESNWSNSVAVNGTPGARNSVTPPDFDFALTRFYSTPPTPIPGESFTLSILVRNLGLSFQSDSLALCEEFSLNGSGSECYRIRAWQLDSIAYGDSALFSTDLMSDNANPRSFVAQLTVNDDRNENNSLRLSLNSTGSAGSILFNEIMVNPEGGMSEWVELINTTQNAMALQGWSFCDGNGIGDTLRRIYLSNIIIQSGGFCVLAADSAILFQTLPQDVPVVIWQSSVPSLNNTGDSLVIFDAATQVIDRIDYRPSWGGNESGVSLERISTGSPTNDPQNWASSLDSSGSTLGRENSREAPVPVESRDLLILEPNPFSPNNDGFDDMLFIRYHLDYPDSRLDLKVYDVRGREVRKLANNQAVTYNGETLWDGRDDSGRDLPTGLYIIYLEALGSGGSRIQSSRRVVALARPS
jgi:hypothetical protein